MLDRLNRHDLSGEEWEHLRMFLPVDQPGGGRWADHRTVINGSSSVPGLAARGGTCRRTSGTNRKTVYNRHRRWSLDGTWEQFLHRLRAGCDEAEDKEWTVSADSTVARAHQHAAGARRVPAADDRARGISE